MPFDLELTPVYPGLTAVYALGSCVGVVVRIPQSAALTAPFRQGGRGEGGCGFFHTESNSMTFGQTEEDAVELFYRARGNGDV